jgi:hypothetical protein
VTPEAVAARLEALREAGAKLRRRPAGETLAAVERIVESWRDPASPWRRSLDAELPDATGFSPAVVAEGARRGFAAWSAAALGAVVADEIGGPDAIEGRSSPRVSGFETTALVLAGQVPMPTVLAMLLPLVLRSPVLAKPASLDPVTPRLAARSVAEFDPELASCVQVASFAGGDDACLRALLRADCVVATGSDAAVAAVAARVEPPRRLVSYGHRLSLAALGPAASRGEALDRAAAALALDVAQWDQLGCLSPIAVWVVDPDAGAADRVAEALARGLAGVEERLPRGRVAPAAAAAIAEARAEAEMRAAAGRRVVLHASATTAWTVVREDAPAPRPSPLHRFVRVHPVRDGAGLLGALRPLGPHLAAVALEGFAGEEPDLAGALADLGASRLCRPGTMQRPPLAWHHDGRGVLAPLARFTDLEGPLARTPGR